MRIFAAIALILFSASFFASCTQSKEEKTVIRFWAMGSEGENVRPLIAEFEKENPGIRVVVQQIPWTAAHEKLLTAYAGETTPDVSQLGNTWIPEFTVLHSLEPLTPYIEQSSIVDPQDFFDGVWKTNVIDSALYGIPWYVDTRVLYYRKDLLRSVGFEAPPKSWPEMLILCKTIKEQAKKDGVVRYPFFLPTSEWAPVVILGMQTGGEFLKDKNSRGNFSGEKFKRAFSLLAEFYQKEYSPSGMQLITNMYNSFSDGLIAMYISGPWNIGEFSRRIPLHLQNEWMTSPLPSIDSIYPGISLPLGTSLVIFRQSKNKDAAWKLIEFLTARKQTISFYGLTGNLPPRKSAWTDTSLSRNMYVKAFYDQLRRVEPLPPVPEWEQIVIKLQLYVEYIATGTLSVDEALRRFDKDVDQMLDKRRWLVESQSR